MMLLEQWMYRDIAHLAYMSLKKYLYTEICILFFIAILLI